MKIGNIVLAMITILVLAFIMSPMFVIILSSFSTTTYATFPPRGFTLKWFSNMTSYSEFLSSIILSVMIATLTTAIALTIGTLASFAIVRHRFTGRDALNAFFVSPMSLPWIVIGIALLMFYTRIFRIETFTGLIIGHLVITTPYVIRTIVAGLTGFDRSLEEASLNLGANEIKTFIKVTLPLIKSGLLSGAIFSFLLSFNDLNVSLFLAGPYIKPFPVLLYNYLFMRTLDPTILALSSVITIMTIGVGIALGRFLRINALIGKR